MQYGKFDNQNKEYVITKPDTPLPWINYLGSESYCALISNTAGGYSFQMDPREQRITRYRYDNIPFDEGGRYIYIRDNETKEFWSPTWQPVRKKLDKYACRHGLGYTKIKSSYKKIETEITYLVPLGENLEVWLLEIKNLDPLIPRSLDAFSFIEFCLWDAFGDMSNFQRTWSTGQAHCEGSTIYHTTMYKNWKDLFAYFHVNQKIAGYDCQRKFFLGDHGYNSLQSPEVVAKGKSTNSLACGWAPIGSHHLKIKLKPGETKTIIFILGTEKEMGNEKKKIEYFSKKENVLSAMEKLKAYWKENLNKIEINTPDSDMNTMVNVWNQYQCRTTFNWSRYASYYESGLGRAMGFRDSNQDTLGFVHMIPEKVRQRILDLASIQFEEGNTFHQYSPLTKKGELLGYSDDSLWLILSAARYIKETGDLDILKEKLPFAIPPKSLPPQVGHHNYIYKDENQEKPKSFGSLYEHLKRAINYSFKTTGPHGLPLAGFADWNDCINMTGPNKKAESVFVAEMLVAVCKEMTPLCDLAGKPSDKKYFEHIRHEMSLRINKHAWDGAWYLRDFDDYSKPLGSKNCDEGKIYLETQPWAVMSGAADETRAKKCMDSVKEKLFSKFGIILQQPALTRYYPEHGEISTYPPGLKENAAIFCHPNPWAMIAECILGRGDQAYEYYKAILPASQNNLAEIRKTEPYVYCQMVAGRDHKDFGEGKNSWLTGSASWNFVAATEYILGIRPEYNGLRIDPCIPKKWKKFSVKREFRGARYLITVYNPKNKSKGVKQIKIDGEITKNSLLPVFADNQEHKIEVIM